MDVMQTADLLLILGTHVHEVYGSWVCVCVCVCPENTVTYSAGNGGKKIVGFSLKPLRCRNPALHHMYMVSHFPVESTHAH